MTATLDTSLTSRQTFVDEGSEFHGTFASSRPIVVSGSIQGTVTAPEVTIAPLGAIDGSIKADKFTSAGTLSGTVDAVQVLLSGSVRSDTVIRAEQLDLSLHATHGRLQLSFGPRETPVEAALAAEPALEAQGVVEAAPAADVAPGEAPAADVAQEAASFAEADVAPEAPAADVAQEAASFAEADVALGEAPEADAEPAEQAEAGDEEGAADEGSLAGVEGAEPPALKSKAEARRERRARKKSGRA